MAPAADRAGGRYPGGLPHVLGHRSQLRVVTRRTSIHDSALGGRSDRGSGDRGFAGRVRARASARV
eukprot:2378460-Prymnesium_polylepis.1